MLPDMQILGATIRKRRRQLGMTMREVAIVAEISKPYLSLIETNLVNNPPSDAMLGKLEKVLNWSEGYLRRQATIIRTAPDVLALIPADVLEQYLSAPVLARKTA